MPWMALALLLVRTLQSWLSGEVIWACPTPGQRRRRKKKIEV
jgi:hypothetical protein